MTTRRTPRRPRRRTGRRTARRTVAVVAPRYDQVGGMQGYVRRVVSWLREDDDVDVVVITSKPGLRREDDVVDGVRVIRLGTLFTLSNTPVNPWWLVQLRLLFARLRVDVVNAHSPVPFLADVAVAAAGSRPTVLTYHAGSMLKGTGGLVDLVLGAYERFVLPRVMRRADRVVAVSPVAAKLCPPDAQVIPPGVDTDLFAPAPGPRQEPPTFCFVGRLERTSRWKGVELLLAAVARARRERPEADVRLAVVGDGDDRATLEAEAQRLGIADAVAWHGALAQEEVARVVAGARALVLPSLTDSESFGMSLVEAMACGTAVVGSRVGGIPSVVREGVDGLLVEPGDVEGLAEALTTLVDDPALAERLGAAGREAAESTWAWEHRRHDTLVALAGADLDAEAPARRPRIAVVTDSVSPWHVGGKEQRQHELFTRLAAQGQPIDVYTMKWWHEEDDADTVVRDGVTFHALCRYVPLYSGERRSIRQALVFALSTLKMATKHFDVLEVDAIPFLPLYPARIAAWLRRRPMTTTWHEYWGAAYWRDYLGTAGRLASLVERSAIVLPDRIIAVSDGTAERLLEIRSRPGDISLVTPGIDLAVGELARPTPWSPGERLELVSAGRLLSHKNVDQAVRAVPALVERGIDAHLTVIGRGPEAEALHRLADELGLGDRVEFVAFVPEHRDVLDAMAAAHVVLFPSDREGFGMVALEAMAVGTPVVTSDHADNFARHLVREGRNGAVCPPRADDIADAVVRLLEDLPRLADGARATAAEFDWDRLAARAGAVWAEVAARG